MELPVMVALTAVVTSIVLFKQKEIMSLSVISHYYCRLCLSLLVN